MGRFRKCPISDVDAVGNEPSVIPLTPITDSLVPRGRDKCTSVQPDFIAHSHVVHRLRRLDSFLGEMFGISRDNFIRCFSNSLAVLKLGNWLHLHVLGIHRQAESPDHWSHAKLIIILTVLLC